MRTHRLSLLLIIVLGIVLSACEKKETPIQLPPEGDAIIDRVNMGEYYEDQIFYSLEQGKAIYTSKVNSWDLAFESIPTGLHVFINGGKDMAVHNTHSTDMLAISSAPKLSEDVWQYDSPCGLPDSTAIGEWKNSGVSKNEVYIVKINPSLFPDTFMKVMLVASDASSYTIAYSNLKTNNIKNITIPKDERCNYSYFSFTDGIVHPEPAGKESWDIVFTRYRHMYWELGGFPYIVSGALLNPNKTQATLLDSTGARKFEDIVTADVAQAKFSNFRDVIGFDWKSYNIDKALYTTKPEKVYLVRTNSDQYFKIHFLDFYSSAGVKGSPTLEFKRLQ